MDDSPWDEIERNYFTSMRACRDEEDRALESDFRARSEGLRQQILKNYNAQTELLRQLQELKREYEAKNAELAGLDGELEGVKRERAREREREDEERKAWFRAYRRGGLAFRPAEEVPVEQQPRDGVQVNGREEGLPAAEKESVEDTMADDGEAVNGRDEGSPSAEMEAVEDRLAEHVEAINGRAEGPAAAEMETVGDKIMGDGAVLDGHGDDEPTPGQRTDVEEDLMDTRGLSNEREEPQPQPLADAEGLSNGHRDEDDEQQPTQQETAHAEPLTNGHMQGPEVAENDKRDAAAVANGQEEVPQAMEMEMPGTGAFAEPLEQQATPTVDRDMVDAPTPDGDDREDMDGVEVVGGPQFPEHAQEPETEVEPGLEQSRLEENASLPLPSAPTAQETPGVEATEAALPSPKVESPGDSRPGDSTWAGEDIEMPDVQAPAENERHDVELTQEPSQMTPTAPASPSSSSELSSRHTTPELDTPVSLPREPSLPATPEGLTSGAVEVLGESGEPIGWLQPPDTGNELVDRICQLPIKRPVQIRQGRKFTADDLDAVPRPTDTDARPFKFLSFYVQATGEIQERPCLDCSMNHGLYQTCVVIPDDPDFNRCGNCEWNKRRCHGVPGERPSSSRQGLAAKSPIKSPIKARPFGGSFTAVNDASAADDMEEQTEAAAFKTSEWDKSSESPTRATKKGPRKSLPTTRKPPTPATPAATSFQSETDTLPEITKEVLCLRDDGVVFTDPPMMRGVPLAKISPDHPYWDPEWKPIEEIVEPIRQKHQEKYDQLEQSGSTHRDKHLANRDAKRGRTVLQFLEEGELHPYQLVGKDWINYRITNYDTLFRLAQLLTEELPKMNLDIKPSEWLRHRLWELYQEKGDRFDVAGWISKAYHDRKIEQLREKNGFARVGRPPAHATKSTETGSTSKKSTAPRSLKRKDPHQTPDSTPSKPKMAMPSKASPTAAATAAAPQQNRPKKIKIITSKSQTSGGEPLSAKTPKIVLNSPFPTSATVEKEPLGSPLEYDGYTSTDSISDDKLHPNDWRLHQVRTRTFATNPKVTQYWHWVTENKDKKNPKEIEHQVLEWVRPARWAVFKKPYNFHLMLDDVQEVAFARGSTKVIVMHRKGKDGKDTNPRGNVMAQFKRERTKRRFLSFLREKGVKVVEVGG
jgi:hypothetical protein